MIALALLAALAVPRAEARMPSAMAPARVAEAAGGSQFTCDDDRRMLARFGAENAQAVAVVDVGDGPHVLPLAPLATDYAQVRWSDGRRTLTWDPGVKLMWMDGATHLMCGRTGGHQH